MDHLLNAPTLLRTEGDEREGRDLCSARYVFGPRILSPTHWVINPLLVSYALFINSTRVDRSMLSQSRPPSVEEGDIDRAIHALEAGEPVLVFDAPDREGETDLVFLSERATPELVRLQRHDAGGLICTAISEELRAGLGLPYVPELLGLGRERYPLLTRLAERPRYDRRSAFGITINHRANYTGVTDNERALTIRTVGEIAQRSRSEDAEALRDRFVASFVSPGHVSLIYAAPGLVGERKGHTELTISLARMGGLSESVTVCEMLGDSGGARSPAAARKYAEDHGWPFVTGEAIRRAWDAWSG